MTDSHSISITLQDLMHATDQLRAAIADLSERVVATEREPRTVTIEDMCAATGIGPDTVKKHIRDGNLPGRLVGDRYVIPDLEFDALRRGEWQPRVKPIRSGQNLIHNVRRSG